MCFSQIHDFRDDAKIFSKSSCPIDIKFRLRTENFPRKLSATLNTLVYYHFSFWFKVLAAIDIFVFFCFVFFLFDSVFLFLYLKKEAIPLNFINDWLEKIAKLVLWDKNIRTREGSIIFFITREIFLGGREILHSSKRHSLR